MDTNSCLTRPAVLRVQGHAGTSEVRIVHGAGDQALLFFEGDQILDDDTRDMLGPERWSPEFHLAALRGRLAAETSVLLVMPTTVSAGGQACYGNFLASMTAAGEPLGFKTQGYRAACHLAAILNACKGNCKGGAEIGSQGGGRGDGGEDGVGGDGSGGTAGVTLVGFSKGAAVVNQLLAEMAWREEGLAEAGPGPATQPSSPAPVPSPVPLAAAGAGATGSGDPLPAPLPPPHAPRLAATPPEPPPSSVAALLDSIHTVHFLDAGLNCRGVHLTDPSLAALLGRRHRRRPLAVHLHGTPRQWGDRRRPWIAAERDRFLALLREAGVPASLHHYYEGLPASLRQHFDVIGAMQV